MKCPSCNSTNVIVNGLFYRCNQCGDIDDSTFSMIMESAKQDAKNDIKKVKVRYNTYLKDLKK